MSRELQFIFIREWRISYDWPWECLSSGWFLWDWDRSWVFDCFGGVRVMGLSVESRPRTSDTGACNEI